MAIGQEGVCNNANCYWAKSRRSFIERDCARVVCQSGTDFKPDQPTYQLACNAWVKIFLEKACDWFKKKCYALQCKERASSLINVRSRVDKFESTFDKSERCKKHRARHLAETRSKCSLCGKRSIWHGSRTRENTQKHTEIHKNTQRHTEASRNTQKNMPYCVTNKMQVELVRLEKHLIWQWFSRKHTEAYRNTQKHRETHRNTQKNIKQCSIVSQKQNASGACAAREASDMTLALEKTHIHTETHRRTQIYTKNTETHKNTQKHMPYCVTKAKRKWSLCGKRSIWHTKIQRTTCPQWGKGTRFW